MERRGYARRSSLRLGRRDSSSLLLHGCNPVGRQDYRGRVGLFHGNSHEPAFAAAVIAGCLGGFR